MGERCRFVLPGPPRGKAVAQVTKFGTFIPAKTRAEMDAVRMIARLAMQGRDPFLGPVELKLCAYMPVPKSWPRKKREAALAGLILPATKPDGSNIQKLAEDACLPPHQSRKSKTVIPAALLRVVIKDDGQIVRWQGWKLYAEQPRLVVEIAEIDGVTGP